MTQLCRNDVYLNFFETADAPAWLTLAVRINLRWPPYLAVSFSFESGLSCPVFGRSALKKQPKRRAVSGALVENGIKVLKNFECWIGAIFFLRSFIHESVTSLEKQKFVKTHHGQQQWITHVVFVVR